MSLYEVYLLNKKKECIKVRFKYWDHSIQYFQITNYDKNSKKFHGRLNTDEEISYHAESLDWYLYQSGEDYQTLLIA